MISATKLKSVDFYRSEFLSLIPFGFNLLANVQNSCFLFPLFLFLLEIRNDFFMLLILTCVNRKIPRDLTEASLSGAGLSILAALFMMFLFGMELSNYLTVSTSTSVIVDKSSDHDYLRIDFNISFPALSCEFASVDVSDVLGTNRLNITKTVRKFSIDSNLRPTGSEFHSGTFANAVKHDDEVEGESVEGSLALTTHNFDNYVHQFPITVVNFYAPWCSWCQRLKPAWEKTAKIMKERYDPEIDGRIILAKVDCTLEADLCRRNHIQGYPSIRIFRRGSDVRSFHGSQNRDPKSIQLPTAREKPTELAMVLLSWPCVATLLVVRKNKWIDLAATTPLSTTTLMMTTLATRTYFAVTWPLFESLREG
ncbi:hypothetical protein V8G54_025043 [Vigna mungo]|uniref:Thioredoxin domain-containing protein n=1 Tax=Vigna mungo TaxID=3915 RepID=A0AAQ3N7Z6_VIGMU